MVRLPINVRGQQVVILKGVLRLEESGFNPRTFSIREDTAGQILRSPRLSQDDNRRTTRLTTLPVERS